MKKFTVGVLALFFGITGAFAQRIVENPKYTARNSPTVDIAKIELRDTSTFIYCDVTYPPRQGIRLPSTTYIQTADGGEKLRIRGSEGINLDEEFLMPESGKTSYVLYFPPLDPSASTIDLIECSAANCFNIYDIRLREVKSAKVIPASLEGDWFATTGAGDWSYGFYDRFAVYDNNFWEYGPIRQKGKFTEIILVKGSQSKTLYAKAAKDGKLLIGTDKKQLLPFSRDKIASPSYDYSSEKGFSEPLIKNGEATIRGYIKGYSPKMGIDGGFASKDNILSGDRAKHDFQIDKAGRFEVKVPLDYSGTVRFYIQNAYPSVFVEPGSEITMVINLDEYTRAYPGLESYMKRDRKSLYMGDCAKINTDFQNLSVLFYYEEEKIMKGVLELSAEQYKETILAQLKEKQNLIAEYKAKGAISKKAYQYFETSIRLGAINMLMEFNNLRDYAHYLAEEDKPDSLRTAFKPLELDKSYYSSIKEIPFNPEMAIITTDASAYIANIRGFSFGETEKAPLELAQIVKLLQEKDVPLTEEEKAMEGALASLEGKGGTERRAEVERYSSKMKSLQEKYSQVIGAYRMDSQSQERLKQAQQNLGLEEGLLLDIIRAKNKIKVIEQYYLPMGEQELMAFNKEVSTPFVKEFVQNYNAEVKKELAIEKDMSDVVVNKTPAVAVENLFQAILEKYKGKVVYVDFWATWCGPCMREMPHSKKLKNELGGKDVVFVYLTNESSPLKAWTNKIPEIKGEHFRLNKEEWEYLSKKFDVQGIPRYMLVNQEGQIVLEDALPPSHMKEIVAEIRALLDK